MVDKLEDMMPAFGGQNNRTRCFDHVVNLCAKTITKVFDTRKSKKDSILTDAEKELAELMEGLETEELVMLAEQGDENENDDNTKGWIDECDGMDKEELAELNESVRPVTLLLVKVGVTTAPTDTAFACSPCRFHSFDDSHLLSSIPLPSSCLAGSKSSKPSKWERGRCRETSVRDGTRPS